MSTYVTKSLLVLFAAPDVASDVGDDDKTCSWAAASNPAEWAKLPVGSAESASIMAGHKEEDDEVAASDERLVGVVFGELVICL